MVENKITDAFRPLIGSYFLNTRESDGLWLVEVLSLDKKGLLTSGNLNGKTSYNIGENTYANIVYKEDASKKLLSSLSQNLANIITAMDFKRTISP